MNKRLLILPAAVAALLSACAPKEVATGIEPAPRTGFFARRTQERLPAEKADVAVIFVGGFAELLLTHIRSIYEVMPVLPAKGRQLRAFYSWHGGRGVLRGLSTKLIQEDIERFLKVNPEAHLILIGHSYGGSACMDILRNMKVKTQGRCIVLTLDPVSKLPRSKPRERAEGVDYWINVYCAPYRSIRDSLASVGGPWRECPQADANIVFSGKSRDKFGRRYQHAEAEPLLLELAPGEKHSAFEQLQDACLHLLPQEKGTKH